MQNTWKRQMTFYGVAIAAGVVMLVIAVPQLMGASRIAIPLLMVGVVGGLAVLGGLFGLALAVFFHLWHQKDGE